MACGIGDCQHVSLSAAPQSPYPVSVSEPGGAPMRRDGSSTHCGELLLALLLLPAGALPTAAPAAAYTRIKSPPEGSTPCTVLPLVTEGAWYRVELPSNTTRGPLHEEDVPAHPYCPPTPYGAPPNKAGSVEFDSGAIDWDCGSPPLTASRHARMTLPSLVLTSNKLAPPAPAAPRATLCKDFVEVHTVAAPPAPPGPSSGTKVTL